MFKPLFTSGSLFLKGVDILLENLFKLKENGTNAKTEMMAGITTFMTMAYILAVNPAILSASGMDSGAVFTATAIASCIGTLFMAFFANYPFALAPGMGLNAFFAYTVVGQMGYSWQVALAAVFVEGILFFILSLTKVREAIFNCIPFSLKYGVTGGIGLFIAFIGLQNSHLVVDGATLVSIYPFKASLASGEFYTTGIGALLALVLYNRYRRAAGADRRNFNGGFNDKKCARRNFAGHTYYLGPWHNCGSNRHLYSRPGQRRIFGNAGFFQRLIYTEPDAELYADGFQLYFYL